MKVNQECFKTLKDFNNNPKYRKGINNPGVYIWGFSIEKSDFTVPSNSKMFFPYYVGKVEKGNGCMYQRTQEHLGSLIGGNCSVFDLSAITGSSPILPIGSIHSSYQKSSRKAKKSGGIGPMLPDDTYPSLLHFPEGIHRMFHFNTDLKIKAELDWMLRHFCITFFSLETYNKKDLIDLEKYFGNIIGYNRLITKPYVKPDLTVEIVDGNKNIFVTEYEHLFHHCRGMMTASKFGI